MVHEWSLRGGCVLQNYVACLFHIVSLLWRSGVERYIFAVVVGGRSGVVDDRAIIRIGDVFVLLVVCIFPPSISSQNAKMTGLSVVYLLSIFEV